MRCSRELSSQRNPFAKAEAMFYRTFDASKGHDRGIGTKFGEQSKSPLVTPKSVTKENRKWLPSSFLEGEDRVDEGWTACSGISDQICE